MTSENENIAINNDIITLNYFHPMWMFHHHYPS